MLSPFGVTHFRWISRASSSLSHSGLRVTASCYRGVQYTIFIPRSRKKKNLLLRSDHLKDLCNFGSCAFLVFNPHQYLTSEKLGRRWPRFVLVYQFSQRRRVWSRHHRGSSKQSVWLEVAGSEVRYERHEAYQCAATARQSCVERRPMSWYFKAKADPLSISKGVFHRNDGS